MADNYGKDKQISDDFNENIDNISINNNNTNNIDNNENEMISKDMTHLSTNIDNDIEKKENNEIKDEEESHDIKTPDLANSVPILESESEKRCTSTSNAGESEYESADDEDVNQINDNNCIEDNVIVNQCENEENESINKINDKPNEEMNVINTEISTNSLSENDSNLIEDQVINEKTVEIIVKDQEIKELIVRDQEINELMSESNEEINRQSSNEEVIDDNSCIEKNVDSIEVKDETEEVSEDSKLDTIESNNNVIEDSEKPNEDLNEELEHHIEDDVNVKDNYESEKMNANEIDEEFIDEEGGNEGIAEIDDDEDYEDIEDSDDCSVNSDSKQQELIQKENDRLEEEERQEGDGEESNDSQLNAKDKALDHDEDKRNPQYIPKRGPFYEHDDRMSESGLIEEAPVVEEETPPKPIVIAKKPVELEKPEKKIRKKLWNESDRWGHDLFNEDEQLPKSKDELVNIYGYDIRNEDDPPKAIRRRRYGRGPNKYTRQWQDENAYAKGGKVSPINDHNRSIRNENNDRNERIDNERIGSERTSIERLGNDRIVNERIGSDRSANERSFSERKDRERQHNTRDRNDRTVRSENNDFSHRKSNIKPDKPIIEKKRFEPEENIGKRVQSFSTDDFPELPNSDLRKKITSNTNTQKRENWKTQSRYSTHSSGEVEDKRDKEFKTEPMKIIEAIENSNRSIGYNENNSSNIVRTQTFENSKYSQRRSSANFEYEEEERRGGKAKSRPNNEITGRAIRKTNNNLSFPNYNQGREVSSDNYRNRNNGRSERSYYEESNRNIDRYHDDEQFRTHRESSNYISDTTLGLQKMSIEEKTTLLNRTNESEQTKQTKRYSSLRQQRIIPENIQNISTNSQVGQSGDARNMNSHQFFETHQMPSPAYYPETTAPRNTYHTYMSPNAVEQQPQSLPSNFLPPQLSTRFITQPTVPPNGEQTRYLPQTVAANVVTASVSPAIPALSQAGPPPPPAVMSAPPPPPGPTYIQSFPSGYPQFPPVFPDNPPQPPTHVPPGYPGHVAPPPPPTPLQLAELYRGGVTYYDTHSQQQHTIRHVPQRRPKAAIPIVPPPDQHSSDGDGDKSYVSVNS